MAAVMNEAGLAGLLPFHVVTFDQPSWPGCYISCHRFPKSGQGKRVQGTIPMQSVDATYDYLDGMVVGKITQVYQNGGADWADAVTTIPKLSHVAVRGLKVTTPTGVIIATVKELKKAEKIYEEAVAAGKKAALASLVADDQSITLRLGNVAKNSQLTVEFWVSFLVQRLTPNVFRVVFPISWGPRYGPDSHSGRPSYKDSNTAIKVTLRYPGLTLPTITVPGVTCESRPAENCTVATVNGRLNKDIAFHVVASTPGSRVAPAAYTTPSPIYGGDQGYVTVATHATALDTVVNAPVHVVVTADASGSMMSGAAQMLSLAVAQLLNKLTPDVDSFSLYVFGTVTVLAIPEIIVPNDSKALKALKEKVDAFVTKDAGGTEFLLAYKELDKASSAKPAHGRHRRHVIITDGQVSNERETQECCKIAQSLIGKGEQTWLVGIGAVKEAEIDRLAQAGGAGAFVVREEAEIAAVVPQLALLLRQPILLSPTIEFTNINGETEQVLPVATWIANEKTHIQTLAEVSSASRLTQPPVQSLDMAVDQIKTVEAGLVKYTATLPEAFGIIRPPYLQCYGTTVFAFVSHNVPRVLTIKAGGGALSVPVQLVMGISGDDAQQRGASIAAIGGHEVLLQIEQTLAREAAGIDKESFRDAVVRLSEKTSVVCAGFSALVGVEQPLPEGAQVPMPTDDSKDDPTSNNDGKDENGEDLDNGWQILHSELEQSAAPPKYELNEDEGGRDQLEGCSAGSPIYPILHSQSMQLGSPPTKGLQEMSKKMSRGGQSPLRFQRLANEKAANAAARSAAASSHRYETNEELIPKSRSFRGMMRSMAAPMAAMGAPLPPPAPTAMPAAAYGFPSHGSVAINECLLLDYEHDAEEADDAVFEGCDVDEISSVEEQVAAVKGIMQNDITQVLNRGERLDSLVTKSESIKEAAQFKKSSTHLKSGGSVLGTVANKLFGTTRGGPAAPKAAPTRPVDTELVKQAVSQLLRAQQNNGSWDEDDFATFEAKLKAAWLWDAVNFVYSIDALSTSPDVVATFKIVKILDSQDIRTIFQNSKLAATLTAAIASAQVWLASQPTA